MDKTEDSSGDDADDGVAPTPAPTAAFCLPGKHSIPRDGPLRLLPVRTITFHHPAGDEIVWKYVFNSPLSAVVCDRHVTDVRGLEQS